ncbi:hypothetical protein Rhopal_007386-T1 [Rhodotorula paludigena]|uniref:Uncharacterized protein n=1 Tax=Rhodotorula paludigena TaxID=86838 RepID=A0AAV5GZ92_9BASI|nr:hypothetical protein Rhopal_007386-T1 [Rhodotorula paludigena]
MYITRQHREAEAHLKSARSLTPDVLERLNLQSLQSKDDGLLELQYRASVLGDAELHEIHTIRRKIGAEILRPALARQLATSKDGQESLSLKLDLEYRPFKLLRFIDEHRIGGDAERNAMQLHASIQDLYDRKFPKKT